MLGAIGWWGFGKGNTEVAKYALAASLVLLASVLWGIFAAPKSKRRLPLVQRLLFELCMFLTAAFLLYQSGGAVMGIAFAITAGISITLAFLLEQ